MASIESYVNRKIPYSKKVNPLVTLIGIHVILFAVLGLGKAYSLLRNPDSAVSLQFFYTNIFQWFVLPANFSEWLAQLWTVFTHSFVHDSVWKLLGNMLWLWTFGFLLQDLTGNRKIVPIYLYGTFGGALMYMLVMHTVPSLQGTRATSYLFGASPGIMALAAAITAISPKYKLMPAIRGGISLWVVTAIYFAITLATMRPAQLSWYAAFIGGGAMGYLYIYLYRQGFDLGKWMYALYDFLTGAFSPAPKPRDAFKKEIFYKNEGSPYKKTISLTEKNIDALLDKIIESGIDSLTIEEKELLKKAGEENM